MRGKRREFVQCRRGDGQDEEREGGSVTLGRGIGMGGGEDDGRIG